MNAFWAGLAPSRHVSGFCGHSIQHPACGSNSAGMRKPSFFGLVSCRFMSISRAAVSLAGEGSGICRSSFLYASASQARLASAAALQIQQHPKCLLYCTRLRPENALADRQRAMRRICLFWLSDLPRDQSSQCKFVSETISHGQRASLFAASDMTRSRRSVY